MKTLVWLIGGGVAVVAMVQLQAYRQRDEHKSEVSKQVGAPPIEIAGNMSDEGKEHLGEAIACALGFPFSGQTRALALEYGLQDVRGLAVDANAHVLFLIESDRAVFTYNLVSPEGFGARENLKDLYACPKEPCATADKRGAAVLGNRLYIAEHARQRIGMLPSKPDTMQRISEIVPGEPSDEISGPVGIAAVRDALFITDDRPRTGPNTTITSFDHDYTWWISHGRPNAIGTVYTCPPSNCQPVPIGTTLGQPSGIAALGPNGPVFVAEADENEVRWPIFRKNQENRWEQSGALGSAKLAENRASTFFGIAVDDQGRYIFAAGPGGLYVFSTSGSALGRVVFEEPVTGVASYRESVFLVVGHTLCRLKLSPANTIPAGIPLAPPIDGKLPDPSAIPPKSTSGGGDPSQIPSTPLPGKSTEPSGGQPKLPGGAGDPHHPRPPGPPNRAAKLQDILFDYDRSSFRPDGDSAMDANVAVIALIVQQRRRQRIVLEGRADERGSNEYDDRLSKQRADAVAERLRKVIPGVVIDVRPYGKRRPICASSDGEPCRQQNRSVHFLIEP